MAVPFEAVSILSPYSGDLSRIELFAEQLDLSAQLVRAGGLARGRMALVAIDNLAEVLLYRHIEFTFNASEEFVRVPVRRYDQRARSRLRLSFDRKVSLAMTQHEGPFTEFYPKPVLNRADATIFRVAHRYRNGVYHEDRHNRALLDPLARLYLSAVGRAWCRAQPPMSTGALPERLSELPHVARTADRNACVTLVATAASITNELLQDLGVDHHELADELAADLVHRADQTDEAWAELVSRGMPAGTHQEMLRTAELRHVHRADPELVRLQDEASAVLGQLVDRADELPSDDLLAQVVEAEEAQRDRIIELRRSFRPQLNLRTASSIRTAARRLKQLHDLGRLLMRYEGHDERLRLLEDCLAWIDLEWDRAVAWEEEIARGK